MGVLEMNDKLKKILLKVHVDEKYFEELSNTKYKYDSDEKNQKITIVIENDYNLSLSFYEEIKRKFEDYFNNAKVSLKIKNSSKVTKNLNEYLNHASKQKNLFPKLDVFLSKATIVADTINFKVINDVEERELLDVLKKLEKFLNTYGVSFSHNCETDTGLKNEINGFIEEETNKIISKPIIQRSNESFSFPKRRKKITDDLTIFGNAIDPKDEIYSIYSLVGENKDIIIEGKVFDTSEFIPNGKNFKILSLKLSDMTDSIVAKIFVRDTDDYDKLVKETRPGKWIKLKGSTKFDTYANNELTFNAYDVYKSKKSDPKREDTSELKRVELHAHTQMSQMDGLCDVKDLIKQAHKWGHKAIAITDHDCAQSYPGAFYTMSDINKNIEEEKDKFKVLFGTELTLIEDTVDIVKRPTEAVMFDETFVVFDFETTGFNAAAGDQIIEIGAVKIKGGEIIEKYQSFVDPKRPLEQKIIDITNITNEDLKGAPDLVTAIKAFKDWIGDMPLVAHNAKFDASFLEMSYKVAGLDEFNNPLIDTLAISRLLDGGNKHSLSALVKRYDVSFDESHHHRADYDAEATAVVFYRMIQKLANQDILKISDLNMLINSDEIYKYGKGYHINLISKTRKGLKNLFKILSFASTTYFYKGSARILRSVLNDLKEDILIGSSCYQSEIFEEARSKSDSELLDLISFYDYVEVQPLECYDHLLQMGDFANLHELEEHVKRIVRLVKEAGKFIVATGDVHHINREDKIFREVLVNQKVPGGGRHPLARDSIKDIPSLHFRTTDEMLSDFSFLDEDLAREIVIDNPNKIADLVTIYDVFIPSKNPFSPTIENSGEITKDYVYNKAYSLYGKPLPKIVEDRIEQELSGIFKGGFDVIYLLAQKLVKKSNDDGYLVGSRGSVGSSFVATMMDITEVNPLPAHYRCPKCNNSEFSDENDEAYSKNYSSGYDLPNKVCPKCNSNFEKEGQDMPFATFLGFNADKVPDIDLNFSGDYQSQAHEYTKEICHGADYVYRAGTVGTIADKTAYGFVLGYFEDRIMNAITKIAKEIGKTVEDLLSVDKKEKPAIIAKKFLLIQESIRKEFPREMLGEYDELIKKIKSSIGKRTAEIERIANGCIGVKRTTGQHPGGIVVIPEYMEVYDFTPYQFPAGNEDAEWKTTHFEYHALENNLLKLDILGHDDPTILRMLQDLSGLDVTKLPMDDPNILSLLSSTKALGVTEEEIMCPTGTMGLPELGTKFVINMLRDTKPKTFAELVKISGLSHGTDVWAGNASLLIEKNIVPFKDVIGCRDDIMTYLSYQGLEPIDAFKIMEFVRKGLPSKKPDEWEKHEKLMREKNIPEWYIDSCQKIKYMFPKAHAVAYVMSALRIAWFKVYRPVLFYASYFSIRSEEFDINTMSKGYDAIKDSLEYLNLKGYDKTNKEENLQTVLEMALEATARGITFASVDLNISDAKLFQVNEEEKILIPPFRTIEGLGDTVAKALVEEREKKPFISIEDIKKRGKASSTTIEKMKAMGVLNGLEESNQLSLF